MKRFAGALIASRSSRLLLRVRTGDVLDAASEARLKEGLAFAKQGKYEQARASFLQTLMLSLGSPNVLLNLAIGEHGAGHPVEALGHLKMYLASPKVDPKNAQEVKQTLYDALWRAPGHLKIQADRGDSVVRDGDVKLGNAPLADVVDVSTGKHRVATATRSVDVTVSAGETKDIVLVAERPSAHVPSATSGAVPEPTAEPPAETQASAARWIVPIGFGVVAAGALATGIGCDAGNRRAVEMADKTLSYVGYISLEPSLLEQWRRLYSCRATQRRRQGTCALFRSPVRTERPFKFKSAFEERESDAKVSSVHRRRSLAHGRRLSGLGPSALRLRRM